MAEPKDSQDPPGLAGHPKPIQVPEPQAALGQEGLREEEGPAPMEGYELDNNRKDKEEIAELKALIQSVKINHAFKCKESQDEKVKNEKEFEMFKKQSQINYKSLLEENYKLNEDMIQQQQVKDLAIALLEAELKKVKAEQILKEFRFKSSDNSEAEVEIVETDECIVTALCSGNCDHISCRMQTMKLQGARRTSPTASAENQKLIKCPQCNFSSAVKSHIEKHVQNKHGSLPNCPFCHIGFLNVGALKRHIGNTHKEDVESVATRPSVLIQRSETGSNVSRGPCIFYMQPQGCKKGAMCDFSHDTGRQLPKVAKIPKLCYNGRDCTWKPRCRYLHPEDGETMPVRIAKEGGRRPQVKHCHWSAEECPRGGPSTCSFLHRTQQNNQDFVTPDVSRLPPGYSLASLAEFPGLPGQMRPSLFRQNPQYSQ